MNSASTPPGWYDDGHGRLRWWDGSQWTTHTAPLAGQQTPPLQQSVGPRTATPLTYEQERNLVKVTTSKLWWILPVVLLLAALVGVLAAVAVWQGADPKPLKETFAAYEAAERAGDCAALEAVTTPSFRGDLVPDDYYTCEQWQRTVAGRDRSSEFVWGMRFGPVGILVVDDASFDDRGFGDGSSASVTTYTFIRQGGVWRLQDHD